MAHRLVSILIALFSIVGGAHAQDTTVRSGNPEIIAIADSYMTAYHHLDLEALEALYDEDVVFIDPTVAGLPEVFSWTGRDRILREIAGWRTGMVRFDFQADRIYESAGRVVYIGNVVSEVERPNGTRKATYPLITIVTVQEGRIIEHRDYTDYAATRRLN
jgi:ketosteroid isomerase-like protein